MAKPKTKPSRRKAKPARARKASGARKPSARPAPPPRPSAPRTPVWEIAPEQQIIGAAFLGKARADAEPGGRLTLVLEAPVATGDTIRIKGHVTDLTQRVEHLEIAGDRSPAASPGDTVHITVADSVRAGDAVYKL